MSILGYTRVYMGILEYSWVYKGIHGYILFILFLKFYLFNTLFRHGKNISYKIKI